ncbi:formate--tetrahydrofolate ligase [Pseudoalteromonas sp. MMG010]|uniref:GumC family protein n=1 Tax=Pseudoalteromonas sp. MMG010 TaxID=2822685 RepID=UPI001B3A78A8|nr:polysaccharide biosynthesis tyrosine autokinase [Pseudoalteromonas sp. MMG010]MBQ4834132.1 formate--tetrahydrofolate ligase [Pseudoalteromonas sp. MMG010]
MDYKNLNLTNTHKNEVININAYLNVLKNNKWKIISFAVVITITVAMFTMTLIPRYSATATLLIESESTKAVSFDEVYGLDSSKKEYYLTQFEILKSSNIAKEVIKNLNLKSHSDFMSEPSFTQVSINFIKELFPFLPRNIEPILSPTIQAQRELLNLVHIFKSRLIISPIRKTQLVNITFESNDPQMAALVANSVGEVYMQSNLDAKVGITKKASDWLNVRLSDLREQLDTAESKLQLYRETEGLIDIEGVASLISQELEQTSEQLVEARNERNNLRSINKIIAEYGEDSIERLGNMPEITSHRVIQDVKKEMILAQKKVSELGDVYGMKHPKMISAQAELAAVRDNLHSQIKGLIVGIKKEYSRANATVGALEREIESIRLRYQAVSRKETEYNQLLREVETNRSIFNTFLSRSKETEVTSDFNSAVARFTDRAQAPLNPSKPRKKLIIIITFIISLGFAVVTVFIFDALNDTVKSKLDIESKLLHKMLGLFAQVKVEKNGHLYTYAYLDAQYSHLSESVRTLRTGLVLTQQMDRKQHVFSITSTLSGEGKTTTAINLALSLSQIGKTLLIDADLRRPSLNKRFNIPPNKGGLSTLIIDNGTTNDCIVCDDKSDLHILPSGPIPTNPLELLTSTRFTQLIERLKQQFEYIIIDTPPTQAVSDPLIIANSCHAVLYVVKADSTRTSQIKNTLDRFSEINTPIAGVLLNKVDISKGTDAEYADYYNPYGYDVQTSNDGSV